MGFIMTNRIDEPRADWLTRQLQDPEFLKAAAQEDAAFDFVYAIENAMREQGLTRAKLAERLGKSRAYVTQTLRRGHNLTFKTAGELAWGCDLTFKTSLAPAAAASPWRPVDVPQMENVVSLAAYASRTSTGRYVSQQRESANESFLDPLDDRSMVG